MVKGFPQYRQARKIRDTYLYRIEAARHATILYLDVRWRVGEFALHLRPGAFVPGEFAAHFKGEPARVFHLHGVHHGVDHGHNLNKLWRFGCRYTTIKATSAPLTTLRVKYV